MRATQGRDTQEGSTHVGDIELWDEDLATHIRIVGGSGMGKTTLLYDILTQLTMEGAGFALLDPHGELYEQILAFLTFVEYRGDDVSLIDATRREITATVNPFTSKPEPDSIQTKAQVLVDLTLQVWGKGSEAVRADKILYVLYVALLEQERPLSDILAVLENPGIIRDEFARSEWNRLQGKSILDSVTTRLKPLTHNRLRALTDPSQAIDFAQLLNQKILLANVSRSDILGQTECRTLSAFLVAEIWAAAFSRKNRFPPFYLVVDELKILASEELANVLAQAQKFGLHLIILHQSEDQLPAYMRDAVENVSCLIQFVGKGEVRVSGWGSGINYTYFEPEPVVHNTPEMRDSIERYRDTVTIRRVELAPKPSSSAKEFEGMPAIKVSEPALLSGSIIDKGGPQITDPAPISTNSDSARGGKTHQSLQRQIKEIAETYKYHAEVEKALDGGKGFVDVSLEKDGVRIACEVSVSTSATWESKNALKCVDAGYDYIVVVCLQPKAIPALTAKLKIAIPEGDQYKMKIFTPDTFFRFLKQLSTPLNSKKPSKATGPLLNLKEAAEFFDVSPSTLYRWANEGRVPYIRYGRAYRFDREVLVSLGRSNLSGKRMSVVNLEPVKIEKTKTTSKKQQESRYRKMLKLD